MVHLSGTHIIGGSVTWWWCASKLSQLSHQDYYDNQWQTPIKILQPLTPYTTFSQEMAVECWCPHSTFDKLWCPRHLFCLEKWSWSRSNYCRDLLFRLSTRKKNWAQIFTLGKRFQEENRKKPELFSTFSFLGGKLIWGKMGTRCGGGLRKMGLSLTIIQRLVNFLLGFLWKLICLWQWSHLNFDLNYLLNFGMKILACYF